MADAKTVHGSRTPFIIDLGKQSRKDIRRLKKYEGKLMREVDRAVEEAVERLGGAEGDKEIVPIVVLYRKKRSKRKSSGFPLPIPPFPFKF